MVFGKPRKFEESVSQDIDRIADDYVNRIRSIFCDLRNDRLGDVDIRLSKFKPRLPRFTRHARSHDHDIGILRVAVTARVYRTGRTKRRSLPDVKSLAESFFIVDVDHNDLGRNAHNGESISDSRADAARTDNGYFVHKCTFLYL